jgi:hypothetical protein
MTRNRKILVAAVAFGALAVAAGGSAFTASNTVPTTALGQGHATVSGANVTAMNYTLSADKLSVDEVVFTVDPIPSFATAEVKLSSGAASTGWVACAVNGAGDTITCDTHAASNILVAGIDDTALLVH